MSPKLDFPDKVILGEGWPCTKQRNGEDTYIGFQGGPFWASKLITIDNFPRCLRHDIKDRPCYRLVLERTDMEKLAEEVSVWLSSSEAQQQLDEAHEQAEKTTEYLREASRIDPGSLHKPFTV